jgi:hypothetical protein
MAMRIWGSMNPFVEVRAGDLGFEAVAESPVDREETKMVWGEPDFIGGMMAHGRGVCKLGFRPQRTKKDGVVCPQNTQIYADENPGEGIGREKAQKSQN